MAEQRDTPGAPNYRPLRGVSVAGARPGAPVKLYRYRGDHPEQPIKMPARPRREAA